ncbi:uncharacterized protein LOC130809378 isoform X3 [Amaranthus tricolor]|uniref:uncharacterized protein LOC130809378 isoform X3 n=1 Tax=Amaranthus tricolor TaxID=29722 RepID=UPI00258F0157|nr:uncharacterized protein LOC130809378 isoform X3 [Amaranthus tricolor]
MANSDEDAKSDGLEILSIGVLYSGPWDKKYWSSSRGKDRYPYPVGYQARRTHKALTYKLEIFEGSKGPIFQITSNDKQFGSGDTPDRACENFQRKCSRIKLWHGKRFSGKLDGVEFFGFKNALVQRLLRELVATVNDASDRSSAFNNTLEASSKVHDLEVNVTHKDLNLSSDCEKTVVITKRSRTDIGLVKKSACWSTHERSQTPDQVDEVKVLNSVPVKMDIDGQNVPSPVHELSVKSHEVLAYSKAEPCLIQVQSELPCVGICAAASSRGVDMPQEETVLDSQSADVQGVDSPVATGVNEKIQVLPDLLESRSPVLRDPQVHHFGALCVPDTYDSQQDITCATNFDDLRGEQLITRDEPVADLVFSEETKTESHSEEKSYYLKGDSGKSDFDSVDEDVTNSMIAILLPRAIPFLTYSSRKKRRITKQTKDISCTPKSDYIVNGAIPSAKVKPSDGCSSSDRQTKADHLRVTGLLDAESFRYVVPDSLDNDHFVGNELPPSDNAQSVAADLQELQEPKQKGSFLVFDATDSFACQNKTTESKKTFSHEEMQKDSDEMSQNNDVYALHPATPCPSAVPLDPLVKSENQCSISADVNYKPIQHFSKNSDLGIVPDCEDKVDNEARGPEFIPASGKQESFPESTESEMQKYGAPLSESIICRSIEDQCVTEICNGSRNSEIPTPCQAVANGDSDSSKALFNGGWLEGQISNLQNQNVEDALVQNHVLHDQKSSVTGKKKDMKIIGGRNLCVAHPDGFIDNDKIGILHSDSMYQIPDQGRATSQTCASHIEEDKVEINSNCLGENDLNDEIKDTMKFIGCYSLPMRISSITLTKNSDDIYICVSCGLLEDRKRDLFLYKLSAEENCLGNPCIVGYTSMSLPALKDEFGREIACDKSTLQFTPDASGLVLVDSIRMPYCREKVLHCLCPQCESCCFEENAVKIVQIKPGYVSLIKKLNTLYPVHSVLVCEPDHLIALDESGRIYIWIMNSAWSVQTEVFVIPSYDFLPSRIVELKRMPKSASMVVGHNGYGEFSLWDIIKRSVISRFSAAASSVLDFQPISLFSWPTKGISHDKDVMKGCVRKLEEATMMWFSRNTGANISYPREGEDIAVWLLIRTSSESDGQSTCYSHNCHFDSDGCWRPGLLIKNTVILGSALYTSTTAVGASSGSGIIGTQEGRVYVWELITGRKLGALHDLEGNEVLHISTDHFTSSVVAIAGDRQLCVYLHK